VGHVVENGLGEWVGFLKNHADAFAHFDRVHRRRVEVLAMKPNLAGDAGGGDQVVHTVEAT
jgi:hypothetical protein